MESIYFEVKEARELEELADKFKAIGHPERVAILNLLSTCNRTELTVKKIYETLKLDQPGTSRHLRIMQRSGILKRTREGVNTFYSICEDPQVECIKNALVSGTVGT
jgi:ArsR family transcriptional regulator, arsenate/arsenite/antimonite-responsive transcriptional repressor